MDKEGFRICNTQTDCFLPWNRYAETATGIIKTSHKIWLRRTQWVFHIGGWKEKQEGKCHSSRRQERILGTQNSRWEAHSLFKMYLKRTAVQPFQCGADKWSGKTIRRNNSGLRTGKSEVLNLEAIVTELWKRKHGHLDTVSSSPCCVRALLFLRGHLGYTQQIHLTQIHHLAAEKLHASKNINSWQCFSEQDRKMGHLKWGNKSSNL